MPRRSSRLSSTTSSAAVNDADSDKNDGGVLASSSLRPSSPKRKRKVKVEKEHDQNEREEEEENEQEEEENNVDNDDKKEVYEFNGVQYETYQDMVQAKRERNQKVLEASGLLDTARQLKSAAAVGEKSSSSNAAVSQRGLKRRKSNDHQTTRTTRRKSNRLQGIASDGKFVEEERAGKFMVVGQDDTTTTNDSSGNIDNQEAPSLPPTPQFFNNRLNDGSDMTLQEALTQHVSAKWATDDAVSRGQALLGEIVANDEFTIKRNKVDNGNNSSKGTAERLSPRSVVKSSLVIVDDDGHDNKKKKSKEGSSSAVPLLPSSKLIESLAVDRPEQVAKVVPDRIYGMAVHPTMDKLLVCAGDKSGYVGIWNVPQEDQEGPIAAATSNDNGASSHSDDSNDVHLFKYHSGAAASLQWTSDGKTLFSTSYDGTCRMLDATTETVRGVFAAYNDDDAYKSTPGYGLDGGYHYYTQFGCLDHRNESCFFVSSSFGDVYHVDTRVAGRAALTWQHELSEKKINSVRYVRPH